MPLQPQSKDGSSTAFCTSGCATKRAVKEGLPAGCACAVWGVHTRTWMEMRPCWSLRDPNKIQGAYGGVRAWPTADGRAFVTPLVSLHHGISLHCKMAAPLAESCGIERPPGSAESSQPSIVWWPLPQQLRRGGRTGIVGIVGVPSAPDGQRQRGGRCPLLRLGEAMGPSLSFN